MNIIAEEEGKLIIFYYVFIWVQIEEVEIIVMIEENEEVEKEGKVEAMLKDGHTIYLIKAIKITQSI